MSTLKLFVSHSSRLDDVEHRWTRDDRNWRLLEDTCKAIRQKYGDRVEVLVDKEGLVPGDKWNHQLNCWLAECHVAIILFSKRAIEKSDWVAKEAAILSWRAELDENFTLIPVLLEGESKPADLASDFLGALQIDTNQCIKDVKSAKDIVNGIAQKLGEPQDLAGEYPQTPLERLQGGIAKLLAAETTQDSLREALERVGCPMAAGGIPDPGRYADLLARRLLTATPDHADACFHTFQVAIDPLSPRPALDYVRELFRQIRSLWVLPEAAAHLPLARQHKHLLVLAGRFITYADEYLETQAYTLERYIERGSPGTSLYRLVTVAADCEVDDVRKEIRRRFLGAGLPPMIDGASQDQTINQDPKTIVLVIAARSDAGGLPDPTLLRDLEQLETDYQKLVLIFALESTDTVLPNGLRAVRPPLDPHFEEQAFLAERAAKTFLNQKYGIGQ